MGLKQPAPRRNTKHQIGRFLGIARERFYRHTVTDFKQNLNFKGRLSVNWYVVIMVSFKMFFLVTAPHWDHHWWREKSSILNPMRQMNVFFNFNTLGQHCWNSSTQKHILTQKCIQLCSKVEKRRLKCTKMCWFNDNFRVYIYITTLPVYLQMIRIFQITQLNLKQSNCRYYTISLLNHYLWTLSF